MAKFKVCLIKILHISHEVEIELDDDFAEAVKAASEHRNEPGPFKHHEGHAKTRNKLEHLIHEKVPDLDLKGGEIIKGDYECHEATIDGQKVWI